MKVPLFLRVAGLFVLVPPLAGAVYWRRLRGARAWVVAWAVSQAVGTGAQYWLAAQGTNNLWVGYLAEPLSGGLLLWALSLWQSRPLDRLTFRLAIPAALTAFLLLTVAFDSASTFSRAAQPMLYLVCLGASAYTLVGRSRAAADDLLHQDWLWVCAGMVLYYGTGGMLLPLSRLLLGADLHLFIRAYELAAAMAALAFVAVAWGIACPAP